MRNSLLMAQMQLNLLKFPVELTSGQAQMETGEAENPLDVRESEILAPSNKEEVLSVEATADLQGPTHKHEQVEENFEGFDDLFEEPEVISDRRVPQETNENTESAPVCGNNSESNEDEGDRETSVDSSLALFSKPELLMGKVGIAKIVLKS